jgi:hypothetical protein
MKKLDKIWEIDLAVDKEYRWSDVVNTETKIIEKLLNGFLDNLEHIPKLARGLVMGIYNIAGGKHLDEMEGFVSGFDNINIEDFFLMQFSYELEHISRILGQENALLSSIFGCTSGIKSVKGEMHHWRSLDWPMPYGKKATRIFRFVDWLNNREFYTVGVLGMMGVLSGMVPEKYSVSMNWAHPEKLPDITKIGPLFLLREVLEQCNTYKDALYMLKNTPLSTSAMFTICGVGREQGAIIERTQDSYSVYRQNTMPIVQANHYISPKLEHLNLDDELLEDSIERAKTLKTGLKQKQKNPLNISPVKNKNTIHQILMIPETGDIKVWV